MTNFDLTDEEKLALAAELRRTIAEDRYPLSPRVRTLQSPKPSIGARGFFIALDGGFLTEVRRLPSRSSSK